MLANRPRVAIAIVVIIVLVTGAVMSVSGKSNLAPDQGIAGRFLGVAVDNLVMKTKGPIIHPFRGGDRKTSIWEYCPEGAGTGEQVAVRAYVDLDLYYVAYLRWQEDATHWGGPGQGGQALLQREKAHQSALEYAAMKCWFFDPGDKLTYETYKDYLPQPVYSFLWEGLGPEELRHSVEVELSAVTGKVVLYTASILPRDPQSILSVEISADEARSRVEEAIPKLWPEMIEPIKVSLSVVLTRTVYAPAGHPVYPVTIDGHTHAGSDRLYFFGTVCGVDAHTGEVLTAMVRPTDEPRPDAEIKISKEKALQIVQEALPQELREAKVKASELTARCRLAALGTPVYPVRITGKLPAPDESGELWDWAQTWAVDAASGRIYGLHVRSGDEEEELAPLWPSFRHSSR